MNVFYLRSADTKILGFSHLLTPFSNLPLKTGHHPHPVPLGLQNWDGGDGNNRDVYGMEDHTQLHADLSVCYKAISRAGIWQPDKQKAGEMHPGPT